jgi:virulence factor
LLTKRFSKQFAFVGVGAHSTSNLYPVIEYLRLDLPLIVVRDPRKANLINQNFIYTKGSNTLADITGNESITGVFVCSKPETHFGLVKLLLEANKNVFVEKPPCQNSNELAQLINIEKESKGFCMVGLQKRYAPATRTIKSKAKDISTYSYKYLTGQCPRATPFSNCLSTPSIWPYTFLGCRGEIGYQTEKRAGCNLFRTSSAYKWGCGSPRTLHGL